MRCCYLMMDKSKISFFVLISNLQPLIPNNVFPFFCEKSCMEWLDSTFRNYFLISLYYVRNLGKTDLCNGYDALDKFVHLT